MPRTIESNRTPTTIGRHKGVAGRASFRTSRIELGKCNSLGTRLRPKERGIAITRIRSVMPAVVVGLILVGCGRVASSAAPSTVPSVVDGSSGPTSSPTLAPMTEAPRPTETPMPKVQLGYGARVEIDDDADLHMRPATASSVIGSVHAGPVEIEIMDDDTVSPMLGPVEADGLIWYPVRSQRGPLRLAGARRIDVGTDGARLPDLHCPERRGVPEHGAGGACRLLRRPTDVIHGCRRAVRPRRLEPGQLRAGLVGLAAHHEHAGVVGIGGHAERAATPGTRPVAGPISLRDRRTLTRSWTSWSTSLTLRRKIA